MRPWPNSGRLDRVILTLILSAGGDYHHRTQSNTDKRHPSIPTVSRAGARKKDVLMHFPQTAADQNGLNPDRMRPHRS